MLLLPRARLPWVPLSARCCRDNAAKLLGVLRGTPWARHAKLVLMTAEGLSAPDWNYALLQPLSPLKVETWADFSARLPGAEPAAAGGGGCVRGGWEGEDAGAAGAGLPLSSEGGPQRCFRHMYVCARGINITSWPLHGLGQHLVKHYGSLIKAAAAAGQAAPAAARAAAGEQQQQRQQGGDDREDEGSDSAGASGSSRPGGGDRVLRIVFHKRSTKDRQLLNAADLLDRCNRWQYTSRAGQRLRASCAEVRGTERGSLLLAPFLLPAPRRSARGCCDAAPQAELRCLPAMQPYPAAAAQVQLMSLLSGMAAAQEADVFVGVHGANMANAWLMRPGSSMIELQPYGFDQGPAHLQYPLFNKMVRGCLPACLLQLMRRALDRGSAHRVAGSCLVQRRWQCWCAAAPCRTALMLHPPAVLVQDNDTAVLWWLISVCDPKASTPGEQEARGVGTPSRWPRDRNLRVSWGALRRVLETVVEVDGDMREYRRRWEEGRWWWWLGRGGSMEHVGPGRATRMRCPKRAGTADAD